MLYDVNTNHSALSSAAQEYEALAIFNRNPNKHIDGFEVSTYQGVYMKDMDLPQCLDVFNKIVPENKKVLIGSTKYMIYNNNLALIADNCSLEFPLKNKNRNWHISLFGQDNVVYEIYQYLKDNFQKQSDVFVNWMYMLQNGNLETKNFSVIPPKDFHPSSYPFISDVDKYMKEFDESSSNILILLGPPGTGKSTFLKQFLSTVRHSAFTTYDQNVMKADSLYVQFLNSSYKYLILEDSDILLLSREKDDNRIMSKILNASDGLISTKKKFVFTANLTNENQIDDALLRPGRCFDIKHFRHLTLSEAQLVASRMDKTLPKKDEYSLAEIYNNKVQSKRRAGMGFIN